MVLRVPNGYPKGLHICLSHSADSGMCPEDIGAQSDTADGPWCWDGRDVLQGQAPGHPPSCRWGSGSGWNVTCPRGMSFPLFPSPYLSAAPSCSLSTCIRFQVFSLCSERSKRVKNRSDLRVTQKQHSETLQGGGRVLPRATKETEALKILVFMEFEKPCSMFTMWTLLLKHLQRHPKSLFSSQKAQKRKSRALKGNLFRQIFPTCH